MSIAHVSEPATFLDTGLPLFADLPGSGTADLRLKPVWGSAAEPILDEAKAAGADLLVLGTNQKGALARLWPLVDAQRRTQR